MNLFYIWLCSIFLKKCMNKLNLGIQIFQIVLNSIIAPCYCRMTRTVVALHFAERYMDIQKHGRVTEFSYVCFDSLPYGSVGKISVPDTFMRVLYIHGIQVSVFVKEFHVIVAGKHLHQFFPLPVFLLINSSHLHLKSSISETSSL